MTNRSFGGRLHEARRLRGITQHDLAFSIGCHDQEISRYERDAVVPKTDRIEAIARVLGVSPAWLLFGEGEGPVAPDHPESADAPEAA